MLTTDGIAKLVLAGLIVICLLLLAPVAIMHRLAAERCEMRVGGLNGHWVYWYSPRSDGLCFTSDAPEHD